MTYTSTAVSTYTRTHTATHLADVILGSVADILGTLGLDPTRLFADWNTDQCAISNWITEGSLRCVALECHRPNGTVSPDFGIPGVVYGNRRGRSEVHGRSSGPSAIPGKAAKRSSGNDVRSLLQLQVASLGSKGMEFWQ